MSIKALYSFYHKGIVSRFMCDKYSVRQRIDFLQFGHFEMGFWFVRTYFTLLLSSKILIHQYRMPYVQKVRRRIGMPLAFEKLQIQMSISHTA
jgi:hypothetical protein